MLKVTVIHKKDSLDFIPKGSKIIFEKDPSNGFDSNAIKASFEGKDIGYMSANPTTSAPSTSLNHEVYNQVGDRFEGTVVDYFPLSKKTTKYVLIVEVNTGASSSTSTVETKNFKLKVKGSQTTYPKKMEVIDEIKKGNKVFLEVKLEKGKIVVLKEGTLAGVIEEKELSTTSSLAEIEVLKSILETENLEAKVSKAEATSYFIDIAVSSDVLESATTMATKKAISGAKASLVAKGFNEDTLTDIEEYLLANGFNGDDVQDIFATYKVYPKEVAWRIPSKPKTMFKDTFGALETGYTAIVNQFHLLCSGEKGTGKNVYVETFAYVFQRPLYSVAINRETDKYDLVGSKTIDVETTDDGTVENKVKFSPEVLLEAMEVGGILNVDEINFADPGVTGLLHSIGDDRRAIEVPGYKYVQADDNFVMMATMNLNYQGTNELNEALQDRFVDVIFPNNDSIFDILSDKCPSIKKADLQKADRVYSKMVSLVRDRDGQLDDNCITVRGFIQGCTMSKRLGLKKGLEVCVANKIKDSEYRQNVLTIIESLV